jgi:ABC-2 type transport system ATP-binding protein
MNSKIKTYSKGMKQRLGIAQSLLHEPEVIFLDEPTDGVDPVGRREIRELMGRLKSAGYTIFLNSHLLGEVELVCDRVAILQRGELVREGTIRELTEQKGLFEIGIAAGQTFPEEEAKALGYLPRALNATRTMWEIGMTEGQTIDPLIRLIFENGLALRHLLERKATLEDVFMATVDSAEPGTDNRGKKATAVGGSDR